MSEARRLRLIRLLQAAYSGERAAAGAYSGHWRSLRDPRQRFEIRRIEMEEWEHRARVGEMLAALGARPLRRLELQMGLIGSSLGPLCHVSGWLLPMLAAAWLERANVREYSEAARLASACAESGLVPELQRLAAVELEHEHYFRARVLEHWLGAWAVRLLGSPSGPAPQGPSLGRTLDGPAGAESVPGVDPLPREQALGDPVA